MIVYLAGPMTGIEEFNYPHFHRVAKMLREQFGFEVVSPAEQGYDDGALDYGDILDLCMILLSDCDAIILLAGWTKSTGARAELKSALELGKRAFTFNFEPIDANREVCTPMLRELI